jgi:hypothetical protein
MGGQHTAVFFKVLYIIVEASAGKEPKAASHLFFSHAARGSLIIRDNG